MQPQPPQLQCTRLPTECDPATAPPAVGDGNAMRRTRCGNAAAGMYWRAALDTASTAVTLPRSAVGRARHGAAPDARPPTNQRPADGRAARQQRAAARQAQRSALPVANRAPLETHQTPRNQHDG